jgi:hypothetical protein
MVPLPVVVRRAADALLIEVRVEGQPAKILQRPATEELASSLGRVSKAFAPKRGSKKRGKARVKGHDEQAGPCFLLNSYGAAFHDPSMSAIDAWTRAASFRIGSAELTVLCEPAEVVSLLLPTVPIAGVPLTPFIETRDCDARQCEWAWERLRSGGAADEWQPISFEREYQPTIDDVGSRLRVRAAPPASSHIVATPSFLTRVTEAIEPVQQPIPRRLLARRVRTHGLTRTAAPSGLA